MTKRHRLRRSQSLLFGLLMAVSTLLCAAPRIGLLTMSPGEEYWARFGHNALLVVDGDTSTSYNFGYFDFDQPGFLTRFLRGKMLYKLVALPYDYDMAGYAADGRGVSVQWLQLSDRQADELAKALVSNALPENADYRYDYFTSNCSTRVRDALDVVLRGEIKRQTSTRSRGLTYRGEALRLSSPLPWMALGIHFGLGPSADNPTNVWEEGWVPDRLASMLRNVNIDGRPLVQSESELLPARRPPSPVTSPQWKSEFTMASLALLLLLSLLYRPVGSPLQRAGVVTAIGFWLLCGVAGTGLLGLWLATDHSAAWANRNILLASPLCLLLLGAVPALWRDKPPAKWLIITALAVAGSVALALTISWLATRGQRQLEWIVVLLPAHLLLAHRLWIARASAPKASDD